MSDRIPEPLESSDKGKTAIVRKPRTLLRAAGATGSMTMLSRLLGLARDVVIARMFGTSDGADAFFLAFKYPNFLRRLFAEGAFNQAFVPVLSEYRSKRSHGEIKLLVDRVAGELGLVLFLLCLGVVLAAPYIALPLAYGFTDDPAKFDLFVQMLRICFPYLLLISLTAFCGSILNCYDRFTVPAFTPALLNVSLIASAFLLRPWVQTPELALAWGVLVAGLAQLFFQLPFLSRFNLVPIPKWGAVHEGVQRIKKLMIPALFGVSVSQINLLLDTLIASFLVASSVSWLYYSDRLMELPLGIFGIAIATVVLPNLSRKYAEKSPEEFAAMLDWAFRMVCLVAVPATVALIVLAEPLLTALFYGGSFDAQDVSQSAGSLRAYAIGLFAFMSVKIFAPGYFARQDTRTPVRIGVIAMVCNMLLNLLFAFGLGLAHIGLALATSCAAFVNAGLLYRGLSKERVFAFQPGWGLFIMRMLIANITMLALLVFFAADWQQWLEWSKLKQIAVILGLTFGGLTAYVAALAVCGLRLQDLAR